MERQPHVARGDYESERVRRRAHGVAAALLAATLVASPAAGGLNVRITCVDGGTAEVRGPRKSFETTGMCDVDRRPDGICTFSLPPTCLRCMLKRRACPSPDAYLSSCEEHSTAPCPSDVPRWAVHTAATKKGGRQIVREGGVRLALRCLPATDGPAPAPDLGPLTDDWQLGDPHETTDCDPTLAATALLVLGTSHRIRIVQDGTVLAGCIDGAIEYHLGGTVTANTFALDTGPCCSIIREGVSADFSHRLEGPMPVGDSTSPVTARWDFRHYPTATAQCGWSLTGTLTRTGATCATDDDCLGPDACSRCVVGRCRPLPECRYVPFE
ncbi:MAG: hypothetical protein ACREQL_03525 [Candidatus Binatia bacterium]